MTLSVERLVERAESELRARAEPDRAKPMADYMKTGDPFFGVAAPARREVLRIVAKQFRPSDPGDYDAAVRALYGRRHRETRYLAVDYAMKFERFVTIEQMPLFEHLIRDGQWWDFVDGVAVHLVGKVLRDHRGAIAPVLLAWIDDADLWIRRTAILAQNRHGHETDDEMLFAFCRHRMHEREFFIRKAIGWALREYSYTAPDAVKRFLLEHEGELSGLSFREGAKQLRRKGLME